MAKKSLRDRLVESSMRNGAQESAKRLAMFLKQWKEVEKAFLDGWSYKDIWRRLSQDGDIDCSYSSFVHLIRKMKRRQLDFEKDRTRRTKKNAADGMEKSPAPPVKAGITKVDLPLFGQEGKPRDPKRF